MKELRNEVQHVASWCDDNSLVFNTKKIKKIIVDFHIPRPLIWWTFTTVLSVASCHMGSSCGLLAALKQTSGSRKTCACEPAVRAPATLWGAWCRAGCPSAWRSWTRPAPAWRCETTSGCFSGWTPAPSPASDCRLCGGGRWENTVSFENEASRKRAEQRRPVWACRHLWQRWAWWRPVHTAGTRCGSGWTSAGSGWAPRTRCGGVATGRPTRPSTPTPATWRIGQSGKTTQNHNSGCWNPIRIKYKANSFNVTF